MCNQLKELIRTEVLPSLPKEERYDLHSQILRSSRSTTANIAEGWGRYHYKENIKFLYISRGSVAEVLDHALEAKQCGYINQELLNSIRSHCEDCIRLINGYISYLKKAL